MNTIAFQAELRPALPVVFGAKDYWEFRNTLEEMDRILTATGIEERFVLNRLRVPEKGLSSARLRRRYQNLRKALRYGILLGLTGKSYRELSRQVADSQRFQWFTHTSSVDGARPVSKSALERFEKMFSNDEMAALIHDINQSMGDEAAAQKLLYRETALRFDEVFADTTCVKANIHYPVDWVLLRDGSRTLIKAVMLIRAKGIKHRINDPEVFLRKMNKLCIEMTHVRKKKDAKKMRKGIFRRMKRLMKTIQKHAENDHAELSQRWPETGWSELEAQVVLDRIANILDQLPQAMKQAHERIIGERRVANKDKILSLYEPDIHVLVRGKAGAEVEFGNTLYLAEQADGLIVDWRVIEAQSPGDNKLIKASLERIKIAYDSPGSYTADRGFDSPENRINLEELDVINAICPRSVPLLQEQLKDSEFCRRQKRRGQTEGRIGVFKNVYLGAPLRSKGFSNRQVRIEWCILSHNLWKLARMAAQQKENNAEEPAAAA